MRVTIVDNETGERFGVHYFPLYSCATSVAGHPPVGGILDLGGEEVASTVRELEIHVPALDYTTSVPVLEPGSRAGRSPAPLPREITDLLAGITQRTTTHVHIRRQERELAALPMTVLPCSEWSHLSDSRTLAAAYVLPADNTVSVAVSDSIVVEPVAGEAHSLPEIVQAGLPETERVVLTALFDHLSENCDIEYVEPGAELDPWCEATHQMVRSPEQVTGLSGSRTGRGNCLDLSLFLAGCLESLGLRPLIFFSGNVDESPHHALLGCWMNRGRRFRPLLTDAEELDAKLDRGELLVIEATGVCRGEKRLTFEQALRAARDHLREVGCFHALDVAAARPPHGEVRPLSLTHSPIVQRAVWAAESLRKRLEARTRETLHLLHGLCLGEGELTRRLLAVGGGDVKRVCKIIEANLPREGHAGPGEETNSFRVCLETARLNAGIRNSLTIEEIDLLWAVLDSPSRNVRKVLETAGCDFSLVLAELGRRQERPRHETVSRVFRGGGGGSR